MLLIDDSATVGFDLTLVEKLGAFALVAFGVLWIFKWLPVWIQNIFARYDASVTRFDNMISTLKEQSAKDRSALTAQHEESIKAQNDRHDQLMSAHTERHERLIAAWREEQKEEREAANTRSEAILQRMDKNHQEVLSRLNRERP